MRERFKSNKDRDDVSEESYNKFNRVEDDDDFIDEEIIIGGTNKPLSKKQIGILSKIIEREDPDYVRAFLRKPKVSKSKLKRKTKCRCKK
jgi:hypothetical protein